MEMQQRTWLANVTGRRFGARMRPVTTRERFLLNASVLIAVLCHACIHRAWVDEQEGEFTRAACYGNTAEVRAFLDSGMPVDASPAFGRTALSTAAFGGSPDTVRLLLDRGADPNVAMSDAGYGGNMEIMEMLLSRRDRVSGTAVAAALCSAVEGDRPAMVSFLIRHGANVNTPGADGKPALLCAATAGNWRMFQIIADRGANVMGRSSTGETPLMAVAGSGTSDSPAICRYLIDHGALVNAFDDNCKTALMSAVSVARAKYDPVSKRADDNGLAAMKVLLQSGAAVNLRDNRGMSALDDAYQDNDGPAIALLVGAGASR
jgi:hypothetical protein